MGSVRHMEEMRKIGDVQVSKQEQHESLHIDALKDASCEKWSMVISYVTSCNSMPNMLASSTVILRRYCVTSGRIRPNAHHHSRHKKSGCREH